MRIAVISDIIYPWTKGGAELRFLEIYSRLAKEHDVHYFTMRYPGMDADEFEYKGMKVHCVSKGETNLYTQGRRKITPAFSFAVGLLKVMRSRSFDVLHVCQSPYFPFFALWLLKRIKPDVRIIATWYEHWTLAYWLRYLGFLRGTIGFILQQIATKLPDGIISISETTEDALRRIGNRTSGLLGVVLCGVDRDTIRHVSAIVTPVANRLAFVGRLIPEKRVDKFVELFRSVKRFYPEASAVIVGGGPEFERLRQAANGLDIEFTGFVETHEEVLERVAESSVYISFSEREGFNIAALEACQLGLPAFVSLALFDHSNLHRIEKGVLHKVLESLANPPSRANSFDQRLSWGRIAEETEELLEQFIKSTT